MDFVLTVVFLFLTAGVSTSELNGLIYGPGIRSNVHLPVKYFFIQFVDEETGRNYTESPGSDCITVTFELGDGGRARMAPQIYDLQDGSFLVRYRPYKSYGEIRINIIDRSGKHIAQSPYLVSNVFTDECNCPSSLDEWHNSMHCSPMEKQIKDDLELFPYINTYTLGDQAFERHPLWSLVHYSLIDNKLYRRTSGKYTDFKLFSDAILLSITRKVKLPDMEFIINLGDWPVEQKSKYGDDPIPIISWCGSESTNDIIWPTYDVTKSTLEAMRGMQLDMLSTLGNAGPSWNDKIPKAFFRGRDSRQERLDLVRLYRNMTELFDVGLTNFFFFEYKPELYGPKNKAISFFEFFKYKYQINIDGTVAAYRLPYLLIGDAVVIKQDSEYYEHFYHQLEPYKHYIPMQSDLSDIVELVQWAIDNDDTAKEIGKNGQEFAKNNLLPENIYCYIVSLLTEYAKRQISVPERREDMEYVPQPDEACPCKASSSHDHHDEL